MNSQLKVAILPAMEGGTLLGLRSGQPRKNMNYLGLQVRQKRAFSATVGQAKIEKMNSNRFVPIPFFPRIYPDLPVLSSMFIQHCVQIFSSRNHWIIV